MLEAAPRKLTEAAASVAAAAAGAALLLDRLQPQGGAGRGASADRRGALCGAWAGAQRRRIGGCRRAAQGRRPDARVPQAEHAFPAAARSRAADHHDRAGHRRRAVPRLHAGARCGRRARSQLAGVRPSQLHARLPVPARMAGPAEARRADAAGCGVLARPAGEALRAARAVGCAARAVRVGAGRRGDLRVRRRQRDGEGRARHAAADSRRRRQGRLAALDAAARGRYLRDVY